MGRDRERDEEEYVCMSISGYRHSKAETDHVEE